MAHLEQDHDHTSGGPQSPSRRRTLAALLALTSTLGLGSRISVASDVAGLGSGSVLDASRRSNLLERWHRNIGQAQQARYCDSEMGEEIGWLISPLLEGYYYGYLATGEIEWIDRLVDWADAWIRRGVIEPDGSLGWPKIGASGTNIDQLDRLNADSLLGEAMALRPIVLTSKTILMDTRLSSKYGQRAREYLRLSQDMIDKWQRRGVWRVAGNGIISVVLPYGIDAKTGRWTEGEAARNDPKVGFSHQNNKANLVAEWLLAMADATGDTVSRERAAAWFRLMKSRLHLRPDGLYKIWNYWEPAGPWDYNDAGAPKHWIGVHPNPGYYEIDVRAMVVAYEHGVVFTADDINILTRTAISTLRPWAGLAPYDRTVRARFEANIDPDGWAGLFLIPWYLTQKLRDSPP